MACFCLQNRLIVCDTYKFVTAFTLKTVNTLVFLVINKTVRRVSYFSASLTFLCNYWIDSGVTKESNIVLIYVGIRCLVWSVTGMATRL